MSSRRICPDDGTTTLSNAATYNGSDGGDGGGRCLFGFETLGAGMRDYGRRYPGVANTERFVMDRWLPAIVGMLHDANKSCTSWAFVCLWSVVGLAVDRSIDRFVRSFVRS